MPDTLLYEMRSYRVADGRMGDELARGLACILAPADGGRGLFDRYGIPRPVGLWRVLSGPHLPAVIFLYRWQSVAERAHAFETFYEDPDWTALRASTNEGSEIVDNMDDILLRGPPPEALPSEGIYEFARGMPPRGTRTVIGPLAPLCGDDPSDLRVVVHDAAASFAEADGSGRASRILCSRVALSAAT
jgi:hypothetical protein